MTLDPEICYRALSSRDARFDGRFFVGVTSTGIYCRPICPARTPLRRNCRFFPAAAAAAEAGFRACRRCRPEASPGERSVARHVRRRDARAAPRRGRRARPRLASLSWRRASAPASATSGASSRSTSARRRSPSRRRGASTSRSSSSTRLRSRSRRSRTRRASRACAASTRRCVRRGVRRRACCVACRPRRAARSVVLRLGYRPPFDADALLAYLAARAVPGVEEVADGVYRRSVRFERRERRDRGASRSGSERTPAPRSTFPPRSRAT